MAKYYLTSRAIRDLRDIYQYTQETWSRDQADKYLDGIYQTIDRVVKNPYLGKPRKKRAEPYYMVRAGQHFVIYEQYGPDIIIALVPHVQRDIEGIISKLGNRVALEVAYIRRSLP